MARITLTIDTDLFRSLEDLAAGKGITLQALINDLLCSALHPVERGPSPYILALEGWEASEQPGVNLLDRDNLFDRTAKR
jgi:hypothetical protein